VIVDNVNRYLLTTRFVLSLLSHELSPIARGLVIIVWQLWSFLLHLLENRQDSFAVVPLDAPRFNDIVR